MLPLLRSLSDGKEHSIQDLMNTLAREFSLSEDELNALLPSGKQTVFYNRVGWARTYLTKAGLLEMTRRSYYRITERGKQVLASNPSRIDKELLAQFPEYIEFREGASSRRELKAPITNEEEQTPAEILESSYEEIRSGLALELLSLVKKVRLPSLNVLWSNFLSRWDTEDLIVMQHEQ